MNTRLHTVPAFSSFILAITLMMTLSNCNKRTENKDTIAGDNASQETFTPIFDGKTLSQWEGDTTYWRVEDGSLVGEITPDKLLSSNTFIVWTSGKPGDFEFKTEFRITEGGNSGINYRSDTFTEVPHALKGYQADIDGKNSYTGQNYEERGRTTLAYRGEQVTVKPVTSSESALNGLIQHNAWLNRTVTGSLGSRDSLQTLIKTADWNTCRIVAKGNRLQHYINEVLMSDVTDMDTVNGRREGFLGVQVHVGPAMKVEYKNMLLKKL